jgi:hypothetical protein
VCSLCNLRQNCSLCSCRLADDVMLQQQQQQQQQHPVLARAAMEQQQQQLQQQSSFQAFGGEPAAVAAAWGSRQRSYDGERTYFSQRLPLITTRLPVRHTELLTPCRLVWVRFQPVCTHTDMLVGI